MKETHLGELEEMILLTILSEDNMAHGVAIQERLRADLNRKISRGSLHIVLSRLEAKSYLVSSMGEPTPTRGGKSKKNFSVTSSGMSVLTYAKAMRDRYYKLIPIFKFNWI